MFLAPVKNLVSKCGTAFMIFVCVFIPAELLAESIFTNLVFSAFRNFFNMLQLSVFEHF